MILLNLKGMVVNYKVNLITTSYPYKILHSTLHVCTVNYTYMMGLKLAFSLKTGSILIYIVASYSYYKNKTSIHGL